MNQKKPKGLLMQPLFAQISPVAQYWVASHGYRQSSRAGEPVRPLWLRADY
jgi:hypothetical protein